MLDPTSRYNSGQSCRENESEFDQVTASMHDSNFCHFSSHTLEFSCVLSNADNQFPVVAKSATLCGTSDFEVERGGESKRVGLAKFFNWTSSFSSKRAVSDFCWWWSDVILTGNDWGLFVRFRPAILKSDPFWIDLIILEGFIRRKRIVKTNADKTAMESTANRRLMAIIFERGFLAHVMSNLFKSLSRRVHVVRRATRD